MTRVTTGQLQVPLFLSPVDSPALEERLLRQNVRPYNPNATDISGQKVNLPHINQRLQKILEQAAKQPEARACQPSTASQPVTSQPLAFYQELISAGSQDIISTTRFVIRREAAMCNTNMAYTPDFIV